MQASRVRIMWFGGMKLTQCLHCTHLSQCQVLHWFHEEILVTNFRVKIIFCSVLLDLELQKFQPPVLELLNYQKVRRETWPLFQISQDIKVEKVDRIILIKVDILLKMLSMNAVCVENWLDLYESADRRIATLSSAVKWCPNS